MTWQLYWLIPFVGLALILARIFARLRALALRLDEREHYAGEALYRREIECGKCRPDRTACRYATGSRQTRP